MTSTESAGFLIDSNVLLDVMTDDPQWSEWSAEVLVRAVRSAPVFINPIIYAEVSVGFLSIADLDERLSSLRRTGLPYAAGFLAAKAHQAYRRRGGTRRLTLPDFFIGAHAVVESLTLVTRDDRRYRVYFPTLRVISPN